jgi:hypothetical protein
MRQPREVGPRFGLTAYRARVDCARPPERGAHLVSHGEALGELQVPAPHGVTEIAAAFTVDQPCVELPRGVLAPSRTALGETPNGRPCRVPHHAMPTLEPDTYSPWIGAHRGRRRPGPYTTRSGKARVTAAVRLET